MIKMFIAKEIKEGISYTTVNEIREDDKVLCKFDFEKGMIDFTPIADLKNEPVEIHDNDGFEFMRVIQEVCVSKDRDFSEKDGQLYIKLDKAI